jgi:hypothetical protein
LVVRRLRLGQASVRPQKPGFLKKPGFSPAIEKADFMLLPQE